MNNYQIRSVQTNYISDKYKDGKIMWSSDSEPQWYDPEGVLSRNPMATIHSVERLKDGSIYTVGDTVGNSIILGIQFDGIRKDRVNLRLSEQAFLTPLEFLVSSDVYPSSLEIIDKCISELKGIYNETIPN